MPVEPGSTTDNTAEAAIAAQWQRHVYTHVQAHAYASALNPMQAHATAVSQK